MQKLKRIQRRHPTSVQPSDPFATYAEDNRWAAFDIVPRGDGTAKIPYVAKDIKASVNKPLKWINRRSALKLAELAKLDGVGVLLGRIDDDRSLGGVDLDTCRNPETGEIAAWAQEIAERFDSYTEVSPSGTGLKIFFLMSTKAFKAIVKRGLLGKNNNRAEFKIARDEKHPPGIEFDVASRYYTVTTNHVRATPRSINQVKLPTLLWLLEHAGPDFITADAHAPSEEAGKKVLAEYLSRPERSPSVSALLHGDFASLKKDKTRSARDMALVGALKRCGFSRESTHDALHAFEHGACVKKCRQDIRYFKRMWDRAGTSTVGTTAPTELPVIHIAPGLLREAVDHCQRALLAAASNVFRRGELIVQPILAEVEAAGGVKVVTHRLRIVTPPMLVEELSRVARFERSTKDGWSPTDCPQALAASFLARTSTELRPVLSIISAPTMCRDGSVVDKPGYDEATKLLFDPRGAVFGRVPKHPTRKDAKRALAVLKEVVSTFPFVADEDLAVAISAILTAILRATLRKAPLHGFTSPAPGTGKSLLVDVVAIIATGGPCPVHSQGGTKEEADKRISAALLAGDAIFSIDNCSIPLGGDKLCQALTQDVVTSRVLGQSRNVDSPVGCFICATGNNLRMLTDITRRALLCALDAQTERPEQREFDRDASHYAMERRSDCVVAALTIARAYRLAGNPDFKGKKPPLGSFNQWSTTVRDAIMWAGGADPCKTQERARDTDPEYEQHLALVRAWDETIGNRPITLKELVEKAGPEPRVSDLWQALSSVAGEAQAINTRRLGMYVGKIAGRIVDGRRIVKVKGRAHTAKWRLEKAK